MSRSAARLLWAGAALRVGLIAFSALQDAFVKVKYTDIDYDVFTDAATHVLHGGSPFDRETYRYTPLISYIVLPNLLIHPAFGKVVFCLADLAISAVHLHLLTGRGFPENDVSFALSFWLFNPYTATISSRGSADSISSLCITLMLLFLDWRSHALAGFWFGLAVHIRIFPIIYAVPLMVHLGATRHDDASAIFHPRGGIRSLVRVTRGKVLFVLASAATCLGLCWCFYEAYGDEYLREALLYHVGRYDLAHNFSPWFYVFRIVQDANARKLLGLAAFLPQALACVYFGVLRKASLVYAMLVLTMSFVAVNKVVTAQYFAWYLVLMPLAPHLIARLELRTAACLWIGAQLNWLLWAYLYEFEGVDSVLVVVFLSSLLFTLSSLHCIWRLDALERAYAKRKLG